MDRYFLVGWLVLVSGCFEPALQDGVVSCGNGASCPPDFSCNLADQLCYRELPGTTPDGGVADADIPDASPGDPDAPPPPDGALADAAILPVDATPPACSDGVDNDCDGRIDFPDDPGCLNAVEDDEHGSKACDDGLDNDGDGARDFHLPSTSCGLGDPQCTGPDDAKENI